MAAAARAAGLTHLQVHGDADPAAAARGERPAGDPGRRAWTARGRSGARASGADLVLLDAAVAGKHGGTGVAFDWSLLDDAPLGRPFALAGGLRAENVGAAVARMRPVMVDVSSGVEWAPGRKDPGRVRAFVLGRRGGG